MKIGIGSDHGGYNLKREIADFLKKRGYEVIDFEHTEMSRWIIRISDLRLQRL